MFESTIEETDINSSIETIDKIAGGRAVHDNTAGAIVADRDKTAGEAEVIENALGGVETGRGKIAGGDY